MNVVQELGVEAEAEHQQEAGSQPRAWGMVSTLTHTRSGFHILLGENYILPECFSGREKMHVVFVCLSTSGAFFLQLTL